MAKERAQPKQAQEAEITHHEYALFIHQMELSRIWLKQASVVNRLGPFPPTRTKKSLRVESAEWEGIDGGFRATHSLTVEISDRKGPSNEMEAQPPLPDAEICVTLAVDYSSALPMSDAVFSKFRTSNLSLNTWPYFREFVSTMTSRMNWSDFFLPTFKVGTRPPKSAAPSLSAAVAEAGSPVPRRRRKPSNDTA